MLNEFFVGPMVFGIDGFRELRYQAATRGGYMHPGSESTQAAMSGGDWFAVQTQPRKEQLALLHLEKQEFEAYCPYVRAPKRRGRHTVASLVPLFPSYVFVQIDARRQRWRSINGTIGVSRLVTFGHADDRPSSSLPQGLVERFQGMTGEDGALGFDGMISKGDVVQVVGGPFDKLCGVLETAGNLERVTILLSILNQQTRVRINRGMLIAA